MAAGHSDTPDRISDGDLVILHGSMKQVFPLIVKSTAQDFKCRYGSFKHDDIIGARWGDKVDDSKRVILFYDRSL